MSMCLLCGSRKPAPGLTSPSAAREMLHEVRQGVRAIHVPTSFVDLREYNLPLWDGRELDQYESPDLARLQHELAQATGFVLSVPAYWNCISGVVKNMLDLVGSEPFRGKLIGLLVIGMDEPSAWYGVAQLRQSITSLGAWCPPYQMVIGNPRNQPDIEATRRELQRFGAYMGLLITGQTAAFPTLDSNQLDEKVLQHGLKTATR